MSESVRAIGADSLMDQMRITACNYTHSIDQYIDQ